MKPITHYEVYQVRFDRWALRRRFASGLRDRAIEFGRELEVQSGLPVQVIEEILDPESGETALDIIGRYGKAATEVKGPPEDGDISSRIFMIAINAAGVGLIAAAIAAVLLSPMRDSTTRGAYNLLLMFIFAAAGLAAGLTMFKIYVPIELILWGGKTPEVRERMTAILVSGVSWRNQPPPRPAQRSPMFKSTPIVALTPLETNADQGEATSFQIAPVEGPPATATDPTATAPTATALPAVQPQPAAQTPEEIALNAFTESALGVLALARPQLQAFERFGFNLYLAGGARAALAGKELAEDVRRNLLMQTLVRAGINAATAQSFAERLDTALARPRFRALIDAGTEAFIAPPGENGLPTHARLADLLREWSDPSARGAQAETVTFLLTDIVGSTALTAQIGNSGAQRVVRAHNAVVRAAAKTCRGREVKHTGDGMLVIFADPAMAARAAMEIQEEAAAYAMDNPEAPLSLRVGIHSGPVTAEGGEYYGEAALLIDGICASAAAGEIACSEEIMARIANSTFQFQEIGVRVLKGTEIERKIFGLAWTPKPKAGPGRLEYRQIGTVDAS